ncbi:hypothetical protein [uncultured Sphingomonas sp.]|uniref:hypothetical protein n=1 Tax=uncultured Sphingomonas sp. TaxID=158754 RepID=UPI0035CAB1B0
MVVLIVLIGVIGGIVKNRHRHEHKAPRVGGGDAETLRLQDEVRQMKDRIQVLERVITDTHGTVGLDHEIERLRDR